MKHIFKKNQIIITALAIMIAVAGYLNYSGNKLGKEVAQTTALNEASLSQSQTEDVALNDSSLTDIASLDNDPSDPDGVGDATLADGTTDDSASLDTASDDVLSTDMASAAEDQSAGVETAEGEINNNPGEAVLTSGVTNSSNFAAEAKLSREQVRAKNKETLMEVINEDAISEEQKQNAVDSMTQLTQVAEKEASAELMLEAKGFTNSVVSITDGKADVVIGMAELTDAQRAQIEDIVKRKTEISGENIVITPMSQTANETEQTTESK